MVGIYKYSAGLKFTGKIAENNVQALWYLYKNNACYGSTVVRWYKRNVKRNQYNSDIEIGYCYQIKEVEKI